MPRATVSILKFVGTVSLGLLTGISYTHFTLTLPSLSTLPSATHASRTLAHLVSTSAVQSNALLALTCASYTLAFALSPPRVGRHPYLIWTSLLAAAGWGAGKYLGAAYAPLDTAGSPTALRPSSAGSSSAARSRVDDDDYVDATHSTAQLTPTSGSEAGDMAAGPGEGFALGGGVNGEEVRRKIEGWRFVEGVRAGVTGVAFLMGVVGIWGDHGGAAARRA